MNSLSAGGSTNHADAFTKAVQLFEASSPNRKVIVLFTDGNTTAGPTPTPIAMAAKDDGITIYCIGLDGSGGLDVTALETWASAPPASYVLITRMTASWNNFLPISPLISANRVRLISSLTRSFTPISPSPAYSRPIKAVRT